ncbi:MAG TPA: hypothetical protein VG502_01175 [Flexivirga sp.]|uniref:hypothetical protein n=1 Tax=Flexivirga sp. TaxID=1962927 RepID=UPI002CD62881|nr:hypothetical protein [Flexivirga sp.]HWC20885.1 hypothetical protein [Flexivirga sp.]
MSQLTALPRPTARAARTAQPARRAKANTPRLRVVQTQDAAEHTGVGFVLLCVFLLVGGLLALLLLNTNRAQESFAIEKLQAKSAALTDQQQQLAGEIDAQSAPQQLALRAQKMGLEPASKVRYVRKADGTVVGVAKRSGKDSAITVGTLPSTPASRAAGTAVSAASSGLLVTKPKTLKVEKAKPEKSTPDKSTKPAKSTPPAKNAKKPAAKDNPAQSGSSGTPAKAGASDTAAKPKQ